MGAPRRKCGPGPGWGQAGVGSVPAGRIWLSAQSQRALMLGLHRDGRQERRDATWRGGERPPEHGEPGMRPYLPILVQKEPKLRADEESSIRNHGQEGLLSGVLDGRVCVQISGADPRPRYPVPWPCPSPWGVGAAITDGGNVAVTLCGGGAGACTRAPPLPPTLLTLPHSVHLRSWSRPGSVRSLRCWPALPEAWTACSFSAWCP